MSAPTVVAIKRAVRDTIAKHVSGVFPVTTLNGNATSSGVTATVHPLLNSNSVSRILPGQRFTFYDGLGEITLTVSTVSNDGATITFATSPGTGWSSLAHTHTNGTTVYTNLLANAPDATGLKAMAGGDPLVFVTARQAKYGPADMMQNGIFPKFIIHIQLDRPLNPPDPATYDQQSWSAFCEDQGMLDMTAITDCLLRNQGLATDFSASVGITLGTGAGSAEVQLDFGARKVEEAGKVWHYVTTAQLFATAQGDFYGGY